MLNITKLYSKSIFEILKVFCEFDGPFTFTTLLNSSGLSRGSLNNGLKTLLGYNFIELKQISSKNYYISKENSLFISYKKTYNLTKIITLLNGINKEGYELYLFGSYAEATNKEKSDIDLLLIGKDRSLINLITTKLKSLNKEINIIFKTPVEFAKYAKDSKAFYKEFNRTKIRLI